MIQLFSDKIEEVLDKHDVVVSDINKLKKELIDVFIDNQINNTLKNKKRVTVPRDLKNKLKEEGFKDQEITKFYKSFINWVKDTEEGHRWFCTTLDITKDILNSGFAVEYLKEGERLKLNPSNTVIYHREK